MTDTKRELGPSELETVSGGMKWTRGTKNDDVIDLRGQSSLMAGIAGALAGGVGAGLRGGK